MRNTLLVDDLDKKFYLPINFDRLITSIKALNGVKSTSMSDLDPRYVLQEIQKLNETLYVIPEARTSRG
jgi:hypothetical protein